MKIYTCALATLAILAYCSVAMAEEVSRPELGTYAVQQQTGIDYGKTGPATDGDAADASPDEAIHTMKACSPKGVKRPVPAIVMIPGSGTTADSGELEQHAAWLASHGYAVFTPTYRSGEGRRTAYRDVRRAVRFVRDHCTQFGVDPHRIGVWGCAEGGNLAVLLGLVDDQLPASSEGKPSSAETGESVPEDTVSARIQTVVVTGKTNPIKKGLMKHASFDDPPLLILCASDGDAAQRLPTPKSLKEAGIEYVAYEIPAEAPCRALGCQLSIDGQQTAPWRLILDFADEHLKETPLNLAVELERVILRRIRAQDRVLGTRSLVDLRAVLQRAAHRIGREPTPQEMKVAREHAQELADGLVRAAAAGGAAPRITRVTLARAISQLSPQWPFTARVRPATVPPVPAVRLPSDESTE